MNKLNFIVVLIRFVAFYELILVYVIRPQDLCMSSMYKNLGD